MAPRWDGRWRGGRDADGAAVGTADGAAVGTADGAAVGTGNAIEAVDVRRADDQAAAAIAGAVALVDRDVECMDCVPVAGRRWTNAALADPLHCVIVAPAAVAGTHPTVKPSPEPTHWLTVASIGLGSSATYVFVRLTLHRSVPPPPLIEPLHWTTEVTGSVRIETSTVHAASGFPAGPWHSRTVTVADPPTAVIVLSIVTSQIKP